MRAKWVGRMQMEMRDVIDGGGGRVVSVGVVVRCAWESGGGPEKSRPLSLGPCVAAGQARPALTSLAPLISCTRQTADSSTAQRLRVNTTCSYASLSVNYFNHDKRVYVTRQEA
jgi:hypothetical protein